MSTPQVKHCPKCGKEHTNKGMFCSKSHANSRTYTAEQKKVYAKKQSEYLKTAKGANQLTVMRENIAESQLKKVEDKIVITELDEPLEIVAFDEDVKNNDGWSDASDIELVNGVTDEF
jgi:hypothetical protein